MPPPPLPRKRNRSVSPNSSGDSEYDPVTKPRKAAGPSSKLPPGHQLGPNGRPMSREQLRKANHSLIERRRREKINAALADLRGMVPGLGEENGGKGGEFKLEVLERTVEHMRELKRRIADLEADAEAASATKRRRHSTTTEESSMDVDSPRERVEEYRRVPHDRPHRAWRPSPVKPSSSPPSPSMTPPLRTAADPNETEDEANLPPPLTLASRSRSDESHSSQTRTSGSHSTASPHPPSISSLLSSTQPPRTQTSTSRAPPRDIYLPFPTPSPTSPFLSYPSNTSTASSATGPAEPSPFLAPLQNIALFDGALPSPLTGPRRLSPPEKRGEMNTEDAAHVLLAISSPDTLRPTASSGNTPLMNVHRGLERRLTLEAEEFMLDGGVARSGDMRIARHHTQGKTARDILRM
ncbi:hypothetical protein CC85DRAFT_304309 [Cutaneotrichosporon oleaginosum]|uniref:BHLH domain-containing protein n=1 Tax=Cutaneotrichosporon oleaginosum TaxID=879819 RepID=A0A0J0XGS1_9TREE|nr:uncharacterized protein CC85DRAFT_304309 [Cutaneotrichosporon oleaginosum]KLT40263.1 hypothetical protein CC85DRAFT_304309 [Cutaneotrichosporon oleaginosum]TXT11288.1 hypothetical protein COLE_01698 [Cutaneotrichosporon oleaginosum]